MSNTAVYTGESTESFEAAVREIARQLAQNNPDEQIDFTIDAFAYKQGGITGLPPTYIAEVAFLDETVG